MGTLLFDAGFINYYNAVYEIVDFSTIRHDVRASQLYLVILSDSPKIPVTNNCFEICCTNYTKFAASTTACNHAMFCTDMQQVIECFILTSSKCYAKSQYNPLEQIHSFVCNLCKFCQYLSVIALKQSVAVTLKKCYNMQINIFIAMYEMRYPVTAFLS